jgi:thiamine biosynthesis lipoprotein
LCLESTGYSKLTIDYDKKTIAKTKKDLMIDFGSIAKGFAVDEIRLLLLSRGLIDFIVEIGGEVYASGRRKGGGHWRVGINRPWKKAARADIFKVVEISNKAVASSGDYRNFFEQKGKTYSHIIDPVTGWPVSGYVTAVTVIADNTAMADGLATALMLLGCDQGLALIESLDNTDALIITRKGDALESCKSSGWHY